MLTDTADSLKLDTERSGRLGIRNLANYLIGAIFIAFALAVPSDQYSLALSGGVKDLSWGPPLFRALLLFHGVVIVLIGAGAFDGITRSHRVEKTAAPAMNATTLLTLIALTILAFVLRIWNLNSAPWIDEVLTLVDFARLPINELVITFPNQNQHMLYSIATRAAFVLFGESTWALRLPAVLFGLGGIWGLFFFARYVAGNRAALLACLLMTVSYHHVWFSQNARGYTGLLMATLFATWAWLEALERDEWKWWLLYIAAVVTGMWIHMTMAFVVAAHGLVYLLFLAIPQAAGGSPIERRAGLKPIVAWLLCCTITLQLYALSIPEFLRTGLHEESKNSEWTNPIWVITESIQNLSIGFAGIGVVLVGAAFVLFGWLMIFRQNRRASLLMVLPPVLSGGLMLALGHNLFPRFFFFAMGFGILIVIYGALELPEYTTRLISPLRAWTGAARKFGLAAAAMMIALSLFTVPRNYALPKQDFAGAKEYVEARLVPESKAVAVNLAGDMFSKYYAPDWSTTRDAAVLAEIERNNTDVWLVYTMPFEIQAFSPELWNSIQNNYEMVRTFPGTLNGGDVVVCHLKKR